MKSTVNTKKMNSVSFVFKKKVNAGLVVFNIGKILMASFLSILFDDTKCKVLALRLFHCMSKLQYLSGPIE